MKTNIVTVLLITLFMLGLVIPACAHNPAIPVIEKNIKKWQLEIIIENPIVDLKTKQELVQLMTDNKGQQLCELLWNNRVSFICRNTQLDEPAKEMWLTLLMQYKKWGDGEIIRGLEYYRVYGDVEITAGLQTQGGE